MFKPIRAVALVALCAVPVSFSYMGEIVGNDEIHFKRVLMGFDPEDFVAKRSK